MKNNFYNFFKLDQNRILLSSFILFLPIYETITSNFLLLNFNHYKNFFIFYFAILSLIFIFSYIFKKIFLFNSYSFLKLSIFAWLNFYFQDTTSVLEKYFSTYHNYIALILIFVIYIFVVIIFYNKEKVFIKFLTVFIFINFSLQTYQLINIIYYSKIDLANKTIYPLKELNNVKKKRS